MGKRNWSVNHSSFAATRRKAPLPCACIIAAELTNKPYISPEHRAFSPTEFTTERANDNSAVFRGFHFTEWGTLLVAQLVEALRYKSEGRGFDSL